MLFRTTIKNKKKEICGRMGYKLFTAILEERKAEEKEMEGRQGTRPQGNSTEVNL